MLFQCHGIAQCGGRKHYFIDVMDVACYMCTINNTSTLGRTVMTSPLEIFIFLIYFPRHTYFFHSRNYPMFWKQWRYHFIMCGLPEDTGGPDQGPSLM